MREMGVRMRHSLWLLLVVGALHGHDLYIFPERFFVDAGHPCTIGFHNGDAFPESEASPVLERLRDANLLSSSGVVPVGGLRIEGKLATGVVTVQASGEQILTIRTIPNFISLPPAQFLAYLKEEGLEHVIAWREQHKETQKPSRERYSKYAKSIVLAGKSDGFFSHQAGFPIEIIPETDPYRARAGDSIRVRVAFMGKPAANLQLEAAWSDRRQTKVAIAGRTGADGVISVKVDRPGFWRLHTVRMDRCAQPVIADWESYWASLTFEVR